MTPNQNKRILILASYDASLINFRGDLITNLIKEGYTVYCGAPNFQDKNKEKLTKIGATPLEIKMDRTGLNPFKDLATIKNIKKLISKYTIDLVFSYTIKPVIYGSIAARKAKVPSFALITGLGMTFSAINFKSKLFQVLTQRLYKYGLRESKMVIFQNKDDEKLFRKLKVLDQTQKSTVVHGSGINLDRFAFRERHKNDQDIIRFIIVGRLIKEKGVSLFIAAAEKLKEKYPNTEYHLIGGPPKNLENGELALKLKLYNEKNIINYHGPKFGIGPLVAQSDIFVLPTFYREGVPRSILEALSIGMPIITTNTPGCKETIENNENGILIPSQNLEALIDAMEFFITNTDKIHSMGLKSRTLAEKKFDVNIINKQIIKILETS